MPEPVASPSHGASGSSGDLLDTHQFECRCAAIVLQAEFDDFADAFHESIQRLRLGVTTTKGRDSRNVNARLVEFDHYRKLTHPLHAQVLPWLRRTPAPELIGRRKDLSREHGDPRDGILEVLEQELPAAPFSAT